MSGQQAHSIGSLLANARERLVYSESPRLDAEMLLSYALRTTREFLIVNSNEPVSVTREAQFLSLIAERERGVPIAYLTGSREFWSLDLQVTNETLIPRPDSEILVERALPAIRAGALTNVLDLGTGCGAIALAIAVECPQCRVFAVDSSATALDVARRNATRLGIGNVRFFQGSWFEPFDGMRFDLVIGNPPYVASGDPALMTGDVRFEPRLALIGGPDGLDEIRRILLGVDHCLRPGGVLLLEHGDTQGEVVRTMFQEHRFHNLVTHRDLAGRERATAGYLADI